MVAEDTKTELDELKALIKSIMSTSHIAAPNYGCAEWTESRYLYECQEDCPSGCQDGCTTCQNYCPTACEDGCTTCQNYCPTACQNGSTNGEN